MKLIDADMLCNYCDNNINHSITPNEIMRMPFIDAEPVKHGHWIDNNNKTWSCSICQSWIPDEQHSYARYCLHCGAKMDGGANNG